MEKEISAIEKFEGKEIVVIHDIRFKGRQAIEWTVCSKWKDVFI